MKFEGLSPARTRTQKYLEATSWLRPTQDSKMQAFVARELIRLGRTFGIDRSVGGLSMAHRNPRVLAEPMYPQPEIS